MRSDTKKFRLSSDLKNRDFGGLRFNDDGSSQSGHERNHFFLSTGCGTQFEDISALAGLDSSADGRSFVLWDFNRDGWQDVAVLNANNPMLLVYRSDLGLLDAELPGTRHMVAVQLFGGNTTAAPNPDWSNRDGYGAEIVVHLADRRLQRQTRCGEGRAAQNSRTILIGIGGEEVVPKLEVRWPSGRTQVTENVPAGSLVQVHENPAESESGQGFDLRPYGEI